MIGVLDGLRLGFTRIPMYLLLFHCRAIGGDLEAHPLECADVGWFARGRPAVAVGGLSRVGVSIAFAAIRGEPIEPLFDEPTRQALASLRTELARAVESASMIEVAPRRPLPLVGDHLVVDEPGAIGLDAER